MENFFINKTIGDIFKKITVCPLALPSETACGNSALFYIQAE
jgi:hypothetical protein